MLGKYQIVRLLGQGGMGAVFEAVHTGIGKAVAIKTMNPALASDPRSKERFLREAEAASRLEHPHVVGVTDFGSDAEVIYLVMELLRGEDLAALIGRAPAGLDAAFVVDVMLAVCAGVHAAHETGLVHRDLKPQNIFLAHTAVGEIVPKVLDFGISKMVGRNEAHALTQSGSVMGTTHYLSPEQVQGRPLDGRSDEYALGIILYEALTGRRPHEGDTLYAIMRSISEGRFVPPRMLRPDLPTELEAVVLRAMATRADDRFPSVHALGRALLNLASPKGRVLWTDYFSRPQGPLAPGTGWQPWAASTPGVPATVSSARGTPSDVRPISVVRTNELERRRRSRWWPAGLAVLGMGLAVAAYLTGGRPRSTETAHSRQAAQPAPIETQAPVETPARLPRSPRRCRQRVRAARPARPFAGHRPRAAGRESDRRAPARHQDRYRTERPRQEAEPPTRRRAPVESPPAPGRRPPARAAPQGPKRRHHPGLKTADT